MELPDGLLYSTDHEWLKVEGGRAVVGITDFAQDSLGDIVYVSLPTVGATVAPGASCAEVESTKSVSDVYSPVTGTIAAVNEALSDTPELVNGDPYGAGWLFAIDMSEPAELDGLLDIDGYRALTGG